MIIDDVASGAGPTLSASGIARLANVGRAAVSNWRRRYADFPQPVAGTAASPVFDAAEVEDWLRRHDKLHETTAAERTWRYIESYRPAAHCGDALCIVGAYLLIRADQPARKPGPPLTPKQLLTALRRIDRSLGDAIADLLPERWTPYHHTLLMATEELAAEHDDPATSFEYLHTQYVTSASAMSGAAATPDRVTAVMLALAGDAGTIVDSAAGTGSILRAVAERALAEGKPGRYYGQEIKQQYALIALLRLWFVHRCFPSTATPPVMSIKDSLLHDAFPDVRGDVVIINPPFGIHDWGQEKLAYDPRWAYGLPPRTEPELAWVQHSLAHVRPGGTVVILMPPAAAQRPAGRRIRAELIRRGALQAVIALPAGLMPPTAIGLHIWVLTNPDEHTTAGRLLLVDASHARDALLETITNAWRAFMSGRGQVEQPGIHRITSAIELLDDQVDLTPARHLAQPAATTIAGPTEALERLNSLQEALESVRRHVPKLRQAESTWDEVPEAEIGALIRSGAMTLRRPQRDQADDVEKIRENDILLPTTGRQITAAVATAAQIGQDIAAETQVLRVDIDQFDPRFIAGMLTRADKLRGATRTSSTSGGSRRFDVRRLTIPILPLEQQRTFGEAFQRISMFRAAVEELAAEGTEIADALNAGLLAGTLCAAE